VEGDELKLPSFDISEVAAHLNGDVLLLTASPQLALDWKRRLVSAAVAPVCETPAVFSWQQWLLSLTSQIPSMPVSFNRLQEMQLWQQIIGNDLPEASTAAIRGLARHATAAYALMQQYDIEVHELKLAGEESEALAGWITSMHRQLKEEACASRILQADMDAALLFHLEQLVVPQTVMLDGFAEFSPFQQQFLTGLESAGSSVLQLGPCQSETIATLTACADEEAECSFIAARCRGILDQNPHARIAILSSDPISDSSRLGRCLNSVLMPEAAMSPASAQQAVSMVGEALIDIPMIQQLLHMLSIAGQHAITFDDFSSLLFSPWLKGYECERILRAELDATFRRQNRHRLSFKGLLQSPYVQTLPQFLAVIKALADSKPGRQSVRLWVDNVHELLKLSGFVASGKKDETRRSDMEIRQMNAFRDVLVSLVAADAVCGKLSWAQFLSLLRSACAENRLALTAKFPNVVVMPLARISGLKFDHVLVSGLNEEAFPPAAKANPLLPAALQQKKRIPMSSGALAFEYSEYLWQQLLQAAPIIEISYTKQKDEKNLLPSPFAANLDERNAAKSTALARRLELELFEDAPDVPLSSDERVHGGTSIIKNQSACPFRAFATHRLNISGLEETSPGIESTAKGSLIHFALEFIWQQLGSQRALLSMGDEKQSEMIDAAIQYAWSKMKASIDKHTEAIEYRRMHRVLTEWLALERERPDFQIVDVEKEYLLQLPEKAERQFPVKIKADRMDRDQDGRHILIDYKTGFKQSPTKWLNERMEEPQLPLYSLAAGLGINDAVASARVRSGDMAYEGLSGENVGIRGIVTCDGKYKAPEDWQQVLNDWKTNINALADEFVNGRCDVSPRDANACKYCGLEAICRINETGFDTRAS
jgi:probable DNA repair protein